MSYRNKVIVLLAIIAALALVYTASLVFDPEMTGSRSSSYTWLDSRLAPRVGRIVISAGQESYELARKSGQWFVSHNGREYPARQLRVDDIVGIFTERASWPVRYTNAASHERLGLNASASRLVFHGENTVLLDIVIGSHDSTGSEN
jgi:hypothetical protein